MKKLLIGFLFLLLSWASIPISQASVPATITSTASLHTLASQHRLGRNRRYRGPVKAVSAPIGASARCRDGTYSFSQHRRGTCSWHGGVALWL
jgi:hypothetical protein